MFQLQSNTDYYELKKLFDALDTNKEIHISSKDLQLQDRVVEDIKIQNHFYAISINGVYYDAYSFDSYNVVGDFKSYGFIIHTPEDARAGIVDAAIEVVSPIALTWESLADLEDWKKRLSSVLEEAIGQQSIELLEDAEARDPKRI